MAKQSRDLNAFYTRKKLMSSLGGQESDTLMPVYTGGGLGNAASGRPWVTVVGSIASVLSMPATLLKALPDSILQGCTCALTSLFPTLKRHSSQVS